MILYKASKTPGIVSLVVGGIAVGVGLAIYFTKETESYIIMFLLFFLALLMFILGIITLVSSNGKVLLENDYIIFRDFSFAPRDISYAEASTKILKIPVLEIESLKMQGTTKGNAILSGLLGGAIGATIMQKRNPDKLFINLKNQTQLVVFLPLIASEKIKNSLSLQENENGLSSSRLQDKE